MYKKIAFWTLFAGVVGLLIYGAVNRTLVKAAGEESHGNVRVEEQNADQNGKGGSGRNDSERQDEEDLHLAENEDHEWVEITGFVSALDSDNLVVEAEDESQLEISGRTWRFVQEEGFEISVGDQVNLKGFYENEEFEVSEINDITRGAILVIRDEFGTPLWSGRGRW